jgi:hypothetical protein
MSSMNFTPMPLVDVIFIITLTIIIPCQGCYFMSMWTWVWTGGHEQGNKIESFLEIFSNVDIIFKVYSITPRTKYLVMWNNTLPHVMDQWYLWTMDKLFHEHSPQHTFQTKYKKIMLIYCEQFNTWNAQVTFELIFQIPWLSSIFQLCNIQTI